MLCPMRMVLLMLWCFLWGSRVFMRLRNADLNLLAVAIQGVPVG